MNVNELKVGKRISKKGYSGVYFNTLYIYGYGETKHHNFPHLNNLICEDMRYAVVVYISSDYLLMKQSGWDGIDMVLNQKQ